MGFLCSLALGIYNKLIWALQHKFTKCVIFLSLSWIIDYFLPFSASASAIPKAELTAFFGLGAFLGLW